MCVCGLARLVVCVCGAARGVMLLGEVVAVVVGGGTLGRWAGTARVGSCACVGV